MQPGSNQSIILIAQERRLQILELKDKDLHAEITVIEALDGQLITNKLSYRPKNVNDEFM